MKINPECRATAIGSMPHKDPGQALEVIFDHLTEIPFWPQLPMRSYLEGMCPQYSEGIPSVEILEKEKRISVKTGDSLANDVEKFYEAYLTEELEPFAVSSEYAPSLYEYVKKIDGKGKNFFALKGQITGPVTWGLTVSDQNDRAAYYNDMLKDCIIKALGRKARWQTKLLDAANNNVIIFVDEPYLQSIGSATIPVSNEDVKASLNEVIGEIHSEGAAAGVHCCGNTDWSLLSGTDTDIINFDALNFAESLSLYPKEIGEFLERGGAIAWGIVPNTPLVDTVDVNQVVENFRNAVGLLAKQGFKEEYLLERAIVTPTCGADFITISQSEKMLALTQALSDVLRGRY